MHCACKARLIGNPMTHIGEKNVVGRFPYNIADIERIRFHKRTVFKAAFRKPHPRRVEQCAVDIDRNHMPRKPGHLQCEPAVAAAQVDGAHPGFNAYIREHFGGLCPQRLPPACIGHSGAFKETGQGHDEIASMFTRRDDLVRLSRPTASYKGIETIWSGCPLTNEGGNEPVMLLRSTITCPVCGHRETETMRTDACQFFYECMKCKTLLR